MQAKHSNEFRMCRNPNLPGSVSVTVFSHQHSVSSRPSMQLCCPSHQKAHIINRLSQQKCFRPVYPVQGWSVWTGATKHTMNINAITWNSIACFSQSVRSVWQTKSICETSRMSVTQLLIFLSRRKSTYHQLSVHSYEDSCMEITCIRTTICWMTTIYWKLQTNFQE